MRDERIIINLQRKIRKSLTVTISDVRRLIGFPIAFNNHFK